MVESSPARLYCLLIGAVLVVAGIIGFFYEASFKTGDSIRSDEAFDVLAVNGWHNLVHITIGALLLLAAENFRRAPPALSLSKGSRARRRRPGARRGRWPSAWLPSRRCGHLPARAASWSCPARGAATATASRW